MTTRRLYYDDSYLQNFEARVVSCLPAEPVQGPSGMQPGWEVVLEETAFYPDSGGQPHDSGLLGEANVLRVDDDETEVVHIVDREIPAGAMAKGCVNWPRRFDHMQQHTGQHLLSAMFQERFGLPTVSFHLGQESCTIDLRCGEPTRDQLEGAQRAANQVIFEDRAVTVRYGTAEQLERLGVRKQVARTGILRAIEIQGADLQPCGGTHVKSTGQIGMILVRGCAKVRQDWRVEFVCGRRAELFASADHARLKAAAETMGSAPGEVVESVRKLIEERDAHYQNLRAMVQEAAEGKAERLWAGAETLADGTRVVKAVLRGAEREMLQPLATEIVKKGGAAALLGDAESGALVLAQSAGGARDLGVVLRKMFEEFAGKGGGTRDFVRGKLTETGVVEAALQRAKALLAE